ncbi:UNVERIFIED_CONTAM: hypothetical protein FKN15_025274 [Acipenser sinensis]
MNLRSRRNQVLVCSVEGTVAGFSSRRTWLQFERDCGGKRFLGCPVAPSPWSMAEASSHQRKGPLEWRGCGLSRGTVWIGSIFSNFGIFLNSSACGSKPLGRPEIKSM